MGVILVADDSDVARKLVMRAVADEGHESLEAIDGQQALDMVLQHRPDCILLDLIMPKLSGFDVLRELRAQEVETPVVVVTADHQESTRERCEALGAQLITKYPTRAAMRALLRRIMTD